MRILITGHKGFVGRHFYSYFTSLGNTVDGVDIKGPGGMDCRDLFRVDTGHYDLIIHCAAIVGGRAKIEGNPIEVATDLSIDAEFFNWVVQTKQPRVVYFSSSAAYPVVLQTEDTKGHNLYELAIDYDMIYKPDLTYGWCKLTGEMLADYVNRSTKTKVYVFRPFSGYGADQDLSYPFPSFIRRIQNREDPFEIWGDGEQIRDFVYIDDIIQTVCAVIKADYLRPVNICTGVATSFNQLAEIMFKVSGWRAEVKHLLDKPIGVVNRVGNPTMMNTFHVPRFTLEQRIEQILRHEPKTYQA